MAEIKNGLRGKAEMVVQREHLASTIGNIGAEVLSTHWVVLLMEMASRKAVDALLPKGMITVGTGISISHFAATPLGLKVTAEAFLEKVEGRKLTFHVTVRDEFERIAEGVNEQMMVSEEGFLKKVKKKCERMSCSPVRRRHQDLTSGGRLSNEMPNESDEPESGFPPARE